MPEEGPPVIILPPCPHTDRDCFYCDGGEEIPSGANFNHVWHADCVVGARYTRELERISYLLPTSALIWDEAGNATLPDTPLGRAINYIRCRQCQYAITPTNASVVYCRECDTCLYCCTTHTKCTVCNKRVLRSAICNACGVCQPCLSMTTHPCAPANCCGAIVSGGPRYCESCESCLTNCCNCFRCPDCDNRANEECNGCGYCENCCSCDRFRTRGTPELLHSYSASPIKILGMRRNQLKGKTLYGVELEVEVSRGERNSLMRKTHDLMMAAWGGPKPVWIFKDDGSLNYGWEIVTLPLTLADHKKLWSRMKFPDGVVSYQTDTTGLHVHTSRPTALTRGKVFEFLNNKTNWKWLSKLGQRTINEEVHYYQPAYGYTDGKVIKALKGAQKAYDHYLLYNPNTDKGTAELRFFKGNTNTSKVIRAVEFTAAIHAFAGQVRLSSDSMSVSQFFDFVTATPKAYPNLSIWIKEYNKKQNKNQGDDYDV